MTRETNAPPIRSTIAVAAIAAIASLLLLTGCSSARLPSDLGNVDQPGPRDGQVADGGGNLLPVLPPTEEKAESSTVKEELDDAHVLEIIRRRRNQAYARTLMAEGLELFQQQKFQEALDKYHQAEKLLMAITPPSTWHRSTGEDVR